MKKGITVTIDIEKYDRFLEIEKKLEVQTRLAKHWKDSYIELGKRIEEQLTLINK